MASAAAFKPLITYILGAMIVGQILPASAQIMIGGAPSDFRPMILNSYEGLPRLGYQDTRGFAPANGDRYATQKNVRANIDEALLVGAEIESHSYSLGLLARLDFYRRYPDCANGVDAFKGDVERCADILLQPNQRVQPWALYIETLARSMKPNVHESVFCPAGGPCGNVGIERTAVKKPNGKTGYLDEFEQRDMFARLKSQYYPAFQRYYADKYFPTQAYHVDLATLGDYDFDNQQFNVRIQMPLAVAMQKNFAIGYASTVAQAKKPSALQAQSLALKYAPKESFEQALKDNYGNSLAARQVALKMAPAQARTLVQSQTGQRRIFSVVKIDIGTDESRETSYNPFQRMQSLGYNFAENKVAFFSDEALTQKIGEATLVDVPAPVAQDEGPSNRYSLRTDSMLFDSRAFHFLRFGLGDILDTDMERIGYSVSVSERKFFADLERRQEDAQRDFPAGNTAKSQQAAQDRKKQAQNVARWSNTAWTQRAALSSVQRKAYFDYLLGFGPQTEPEASAWPDELPAVEWGLNLATIFPRGYFDTDRASMQLVADDKTRAKIQDFIKDVANAYPVQHLTGVYNLGSVRYDQKTQALTFERWPFAQQTSIRFAQSVSDVQSSQGAPIVHSDAKSKLVYNYVSTSSGIDDAVPDRVISNCRRSERRKSQDCGTVWGNFMQLQWTSTYLALNRALDRPDISVEPKRGLELAQQYRGWRLVVEYSDPQMKLVPYFYKGRNDKTPQQTEARTIFANVDRALIVSPDGEVIWSQTGAKMREAAALTQTTAPKSAALEYQFPSPLPLAHNQQIDGALYDFLLAKYAPETLTERMLDAMLSSRWQYEQFEDAPLGGRFFNQTALQPTSADLQDMRSVFKDWLVTLANRLPSQIQIEMPLQYANNTVSANDRCLRLEMVEGAPIRSNTPTILAQQKKRQCQSAYQNQKSKYEQCQSRAQAVTDAQAALEAAQAKGCEAPAAQSVAQSDPTGSCQINPNTDMALLGQEMQRCLTQMCGSGPKTIASVESYKICLQTAQADLQSQVQVIMAGGAAATSTATVQPANLSCDAAQNELRLSRANYKGLRCDDAQSAPIEPSCDFASEITQPDFWQVGSMRALNDRNCAGNRAFLRSNKVASLLLPKGQPYADTTLSVAIELQEPMMIPYDPPVDVKQPYGLAKATTLLTLTGLKGAPDARGEMVFTARAGALDYALP